MITHAIRTHPALPLRWLIFSRPEAHLKHTFSKNPLCGCEELMVDAECKENVERYLKDNLIKIKDKYHDILPSEWPSPNMLQELLNAVSGLFVLASTCLSCIADPDKDDPSSQLHDLLIFLRRPQGAISKSPLAALDLLYSQIHENIRDSEYQTVRRILVYVSYQNKVDERAYLGSAQALVNYLQLDQRLWSKRRLLSVMSIPELQDAAKSQLRFYHLSFRDFILDPNRSGRFSITEQEALKDIVHRVSTGMKLMRRTSTHLTVRRIL
jgi:hypothetical protein